MNKAILIRFGEIFLKGKNKHIFERMLIHNILAALKDYQLKLTKISGRYILTEYEELYETDIMEKVSHVFGVYSLSPCYVVKTLRQNIEDCLKQIEITTQTFKVDVKRADKFFPIQSTEFAALMGGVILDKKPSLKVNLTKPETCVYIEIREDGNTYIYSTIVKCVGGMPVGSSGGGLLLLSGGIDSPVAGYLMSKRGMPLQAIHFHSFPYTSELAKDKVISLAKIISEYTGNIKLHIVPFTKIQEEIHKHCKPEYMITLMRRIMMRIAERIAKQNDLKAIITGESLAQVASQTIESMTVTNAVIADLPVLRPLIAMDKEDIIEISKKINTYETSILPYEDCCTVFLPEHPIIKPKLEKVLKEEERLNIEELIADAISKIEVVNTDEI
ncbi:MAG: tRNA 4-thiouridine(8) synthase ThiI [Clostridia bacterium]|nr:tRNA 4-thiouridine(8) synthase ThiI [Clostridia bacterium]